MDRFNFTKANLETKALPPKSPGEYLTYSADNVRGLYCRVSGKGRMSFYVRRRCDVDTDELERGQELKVPVRAYHRSDAINAKQLCLEAEKIAAAIASGKDPRKKKAQSTDGTLGDLLIAYSKQLTATGAKTGKVVENTSRRCIERPLPKLWKLPAQKVTRDQIRQLINGELEAGRGNQATKLRAYVRAAYNCALEQEIDFPKIQANPATNIKKPQYQEKRGKRTLTNSETLAYWERVQALESPRRQILAAHLLMGGLRPEELRIALWSDVDPDAATITLFCKKGRQGRVNPAPYTTPVPDWLLSELRELTAGTHQDYVFSVDGGASPIGEQYVGRSVENLVDAMEAAGELENGRFTAGSIRSTVKRILRAEGVSEYLIDKIQMHNQGTVSNRYYSPDELVPEKQEALQTLAAFLGVTDEEA